MTIAPPPEGSMTIAPPVPLSVTYPAVVVGRRSAPPGCRSRPITSGSQYRSMSAVKVCTRSPASGVGGASIGREASR
eukprot:914108-Prorocentrum_minimum.AAC.1